MKKIYIKHLAISENEKISDNVFNNRIAVSIISILLCLTVMVSSAFAFFNYNLKKDFTMRAAKWEILVEDADGNNVKSGYTCPSGIADEIHNFTIYRDGTAERGYCIVKITSIDGDTKAYYTKSFDDEISIKIQAVAGTQVMFVPRWGSPENYGLEPFSGGIIHHSVTPPPEESPEEGSPDSGDGDSTAQQSDSVETSTEIADNESEDNPSSAGEDNLSSDSNASSGDGEPSAPASESPAPSKENSAPPASEGSSASSGGESSGSGASQSSGGESSASSPASSSEGATATSSGSESSSASGSGGEE